jgi:uncharacterized UPF0160 family protein
VSEDHDETPSAAIVRCNDPSASAGEYFVDVFVEFVENKKQRSHHERGVHAPLLGLLSFSNE